MLGFMERKGVFTALLPSLSTLQCLPKASFGWTPAHLHPLSQSLPFKSAQASEPRFLWNIDKSTSVLWVTKDSRKEQIERLQLLCLLLSSPSLPLHKLNPLHWLHICISAGELQLFNDSMPWFPSRKIQDWLRWPRRDRPLSAVLERSIWLKIT